MKASGKQTQETILHLNKWWLLAIPLALLALTVWLYFPSLSYAFEFDDLSNIEKLFAVRHTTLKTIFLQNSRWISYWLNSLYYNWLPVSAKFDPFLYRLGNLVFHCATGILVFFMIKLASVAATRNKFFHYYGTLIAGITAGLFMLHPVQTQTVSYVIQGQLEGLAGFFTMAIITTFLGCSLVKRNSIKKLLQCLLFIVAFIACGSKEIIIVCPMLVLMVDWFFVAQGNYKELKSRRLMHLALFVLIIFLYIYLLKPQFFLNVLGFNSALPNNIGNVLTEHKYQSITPYYFCISQFKVMLHYLWIFIWPFGMSVDYDWKLSRHFLAPDCMVPFTLLLCLALYTVKRLWRNTTDIVSFGILWFFIAILPRCSIIPATELLADYKTYVASVGIFFLAALAFVAALLKISAWFSNKNKSWYGFSCAFIVVLFLSALAFGAYQRNLVWSSPQAFWGNIIKNAPLKARAYNNLGVYYCEANDHQRAIDLFKKAIQLDNYYADPLNNIAVSYSNIGQVDNAIDALKKSVRLMPYHCEIYNNLANMYMQKNDHAHVEELLNTSIKIRPHYGKAYYNLGNFYVKINEMEKAYKAYKHACLKADFDNIYGFLSYGKICMHLKKYDEALDAFQKMLAVDPKSTDARLNSGNIYAARGDYANAERFYRELIPFDPSNAALLYHVGYALQMQQKYQEAIDYYQQAQKLQANYALLYPSLAYCLAKVGKTQQARTLLQNFIAQNPPQEYVQKANELLLAMNKGALK